METACAGMALPDLELNGAGMVVSGSPNGDNGLSGKKLVVDAYGPTVPIGGGAWSGKDFRKVDRIGGMLARELALAAVAEAGAGEAQVTLEYIPGCEGPVHVGVLIDGKPATLERFPVTGAIARDNLGAWRRMSGWPRPWSIWHAGDTSRPACHGTRGEYLNPPEADDLTEGLC